MYELAAFPLFTAGFMAGLCFAILVERGKGAVIFGAASLAQLLLGAFLLLA